jgi:hypothetical protein
VSDIDTGVVDSLKALDPDDLAMSQKCRNQTMLRGTFEEPTALECGLMVVSEAYEALAPICPAIELGGSERSLVRSCGGQRGSGGAAGSMGIGGVGL